MRETIKNDRQSAILDFISAKFIMGYPFCSIYMVQLFCIDFELRKFILQNYSNSKWPLDIHFKMVCFQKLIRSLTDICCPYLPNKKKICWKFSPEMC